MRSWASFTSGTQRGILATRKADVRIGISCPHCCFDFAVLLQVEVAKTKQGVCSTVVIANAGVDLLRSDEGLFGLGVLASTVVDVS